MRRLMLLISPHVTRGSDARRLGSDLGNPPRRIDDRAGHAALRWLWPPAHDAGDALFRGSPASSRLARGHPPPLRTRFRVAGAACV